MTWKHHQERAEPNEKQTRSMKGRKLQSQEMTSRATMLTTIPSVDCSESIMYFTMSLRYFPMSVFNIVDTDANRP